MVRPTKATSTTVARDPSGKLIGDPGPKCCTQVHGSLFDCPGAGPVAFRPVESSTTPTLAEAAWRPHASPISHTPSKRAMPGASTITLRAKESEPSAPSETAIKCLLSGARAYVHMSGT